MPPPNKVHTGPNDYLRCALVYLKDGDRTKVGLRACLTGDEFMSLFYARDAA